MRLFGKWRAKRVASAMTEDEKTFILALGEREEGQTGTWTPHDVGVRLGWDKERTIRAAVGLHKRGLIAAMGEAQRLQHPGPLISRYGGLMYMAGFLATAFAWTIHPLLALPLAGCAYYCGKRCEKTIEDAMLAHFRWMLAEMQKRGVVQINAEALTRDVERMQRGERL